ncbi:HAD family hydrolase [Eubacterium sp.]
MKTGIIFDLDGTLWNATKQIAESWNVVFERYDDIDLRLTTKELEQQMGKLMETIADNLLPNIPVERRYKILQECCEYENKYLLTHSGVLYPDIKDTFKKLNEKYSVYIVSNCQAGYIEAFLKVTDLEKYVTDFENPGRTGNPKADNIRLVIERNNLDKAFYVGDTQGDYDATMAAGIPFIFAAYGFGNIDGDEEEIQGLKELPDLIDKLVEK